MILLLSGPAGIGKSSLSVELIERHGFKAIKSSEHLKSIAELRSLVITRLNLQEIGDQLDIDTDYRWVVDQVAAPQITAAKHQALWLLDSVRKPRQVKHFRETFGNQILHIHLHASEDTLRHRLSTRTRHTNADEYEISYEELVLHPNEIAARSLGEIADIVILYDDISASHAAKIILDNMSRS